MERRKERRKEEREKERGREHRKKTDFEDSVFAEVRCSWPRDIKESDFRGLDVLDLIWIRLY